MVFCHSETEGDPWPGSQSAKVLGEEEAAPAFTLKARMLVWQGS
jgi:hypothetical protein